LTDLNQTVAELEQRLQASLAECDELLQQRAATNEVLQVINASSGDLAPVFDAILERAMRLCEAEFGLLSTCDGGQIRTVSTRGVPPAFAEFRKNNPPVYGPGTGPARILAGERVVHIVDLKSGDAYRTGDPNRRAVVDLGGARTVLLVPLLKNESILGFITIYRKEVRPYSDKQITLLQTFADQAVIAIENARLFNETKEALERQTATADILKVIASSPSDVQPVFEAIATSANRLIGGLSTAVHSLVDDTTYTRMARAGILGAAGNIRPPQPTPIDPGVNFPSRAIVGKGNAALAVHWSLIELSGL
jgi:GAF domain-containing protein